MPKKRSLNEVLKKEVKRQEGKIIILLKVITILTLNGKCKDQQLNELEKSEKKRFPFLHLNHAPEEAKKLIKKLGKKAIGEQKRLLNVEKRIPILL